MDKVITVITTGFLPPIPTLRKPSSCPHPTLRKPSSAFVLCELPFLPSQHNATAAFLLSFVRLLYISDVLLILAFSLLPPLLLTVNGVFNTPLNRVWDTVAPQILGVLRAQKIRYSALNTARFTTTRSEEGEDISTVGPVVIWIATHPASPTHAGTTAEDAHRASADILAVLRANGVEGAVVEWIEGSVQRL
ncbi:hypothetical protein GSI_15576 [Ganoderma sinense ZZ0214-1]|uniref:Uncharacterized protein n=1 Tax=Ganoderma sinense ZZ0214-1 TaxID=1077348 RepID=A0A2G8RMZ9_9APHY|nr:hypothetical protein GSI_15576 [Ganoderma sinense ZZ0214-1]